MIRSSRPATAAEELRPLVDTALGTDGGNAIAGLSMAGESVLALALAKPGLYRSVASPSGCARASDPLGQRAGETGVTAIRSTCGVRTTARRGPPTTLRPRRRAARAEALSAGSGLPRSHHTLDSPFLTHGHTPDTSPSRSFPAASSKRASMPVHTICGSAWANAASPRPTTAPYRHPFLGYRQDAFEKSSPVLATGIGL